jgi:hypothetical protein
LKSSGGTEGAQGASATKMAFREGEEGVQKRGAGDREAAEGNR